MLYGMVKPTIIILLSATSVLLAACSTSGSQDAGERMSARGAVISGRGEAWTDGQRDVRKGQRLVERSTSRLTDGEKKLKRANDAVTAAERQIQSGQSEKTHGEQMISQGTEQMRQAEAAYAAIRNGPSAVAPQ